MSDFNPDTDLIARILQQGYPGVGFAISPEYEGETAYEKLLMVNENQRPTLEELESKAVELGLWGTDRSRWAMS